MSEEQVPDTPRRSARIAHLREYATRVSLPELSASDTNITEQQSDNQPVVLTTVLMPSALSDLNVFSTLVAQRETRDSEDECKLYYQRPPLCEIRYFRPYRDPRSPRQVNEEVRQLLVDHEKYVPARVGYVYGFKHPDDKDIDDGSGPEVLTAIHPVKIGRARNVRRRMQCWRGQCKYRPGLLFCHKMPHHERIEAVVHAQLRNERRKEHLGCAACGARHDEWFDVDPARAERLVRLWQRFARHPTQPPYDASGHLAPRWRQRLQDADMDDEDCWAWFARGDPADPPPASQPGGTQAPQGYSS